MTPDPILCSLHQTLYTPQNHDYASSCSDVVGKSVLSMGASSAPWPLCVRLRPRSRPMGALPLLPLVVAAVPSTGPSGSLPNRKKPRLRIKDGACIMPPAAGTALPSSRPTSSKPSSAGGKRSCVAGRVRAVVYMCRGAESRLCRPLTMRVLLMPSPYDGDTGDTGDLAQMSKERRYESKDSREMENGSMSRLLRSVDARESDDRDAIKVRRGPDQKASRSVGDGGR